MSEWNRFNNTLIDQVNFNEQFINFLQFGKKNRISLSALTRLSLPCTAFFCSLVPYNARILTQTKEIYQGKKYENNLFGSDCLARTELVGPINSLHCCMAFSFAKIIATIGALVINATRLGKNFFP